MDKSNWEAFCKLLGAAAEVTNSKDKTVEAIALYYDLLREYNYNDIVRGVYAHIKTNKFFPTPADIISQIEGSKEENEMFSGEQAFKSVLNAIRKHGTCTSVKFSDPCIHFAIESVGGYQQIGMTEDNDIKWLKKEFINAFSLAKKRNIGWNDVEDKIWGTLDRANGYISELKFVDIGGRRMDRILPDKIIDLRKVGKM